MTYRSASARAVAFDDALREAMSPPVPEAVETEIAPASDPPARADGPERNAADRVATDPPVLDSDSDRTYRDSVEQVATIVPRGAGRVTFTATCELCGRTSVVYLFETDSTVWQCCYCNEPNDGREDLIEAFRQSRLTRWQAQR